MADVDPVAAAAAEVVDKVPAGAVPADLAGKAAKKMYPSPMAYRGNEYAEIINGLLNQVSPYDETGAAGKPHVLANPANKVLVGECAVATAVAWGMSDDATETPMHPGYWLLFATLAFLVVVGVGWYVKTKKAAPPAERSPEREAALAGI